MIKLLSGCWGIMDEEESMKYYRSEDIDKARYITQSLGQHYAEAKTENAAVIPVLEGTKAEATPLYEDHRQAAEKLLWEGWVRGVKGKPLPDGKLERMKR